MTLFRTIQQIAQNAALATKPTDFCTGTVTSDSPLKIRLDEDLLEIDGSAIVLTEAVVEKKMTIQKHHHDCENALGPAAAQYNTPSGSPADVVWIQPNEQGDFTHKHTIDDFVLEAVVTEFGQDLSVDRNDERIVMTFNRALEKDDHVLMLSVMQRQKFIVLSRVFLRDGEEDT